MAPAVITIEFDPVVAVAGFNAQLETIVLAAVILTALVLAARIGVLTVERRRCTPATRIGWIGPRDDHGGDLGV